MGNICKALGLALSLHSLLLPLSAFAAPVALQWNGSGCPKADDHADSAGHKLLAKRDVSGSFDVKRGPGLRLMESRKNCSLLVTSEGAKEQFALEKIELTGKRPKSGGGKQELIVDVSTQGEGQTKSITLESKGDSDTTYKLEKAIAEADQLWSSCERALMVNVKQRMAGPAAGSASVDTINYFFKARACAK